LDPVDSHVLSDTKVADKTDIGDNYYIDIVQFAFRDTKFKYYVQVVDNAGDDFKYSNGDFVNQNHSNLSSKEYWADTITPSKTTPILVGSVSVPSDQIGVASAVVEWRTDQETDAVVEFREKYTRDASGKPTSTLNTGAPFIVIGQNTSPVQRMNTQDHTVKLFGLAPSTEYEYRVVSKNYLGNALIISSVPTLKTVGFTITPTETTTTTSVAEVSWTTNLDASSAFIEYQLQRLPGDEAQGGTAGVEPGVIAASPRDHHVVVKGLRSNRTYTYKIKTISKDGYVAEYPVGEFATFKTRNFDSDQFTIAPSSSNVAERNITSTTAQIVWQTSVPATSWVDYSTKTGVYDISAGNNDLVTTHVVKIEGLVPGTRYFYRVRVKDANEVEYTSAESSFVAVLKPKISNLKIIEVKPYKVTIAWDTNVETETTLNWGKTTGYGEKRGKNEMTKVHQLTIDGLEDNTEYHYQIVAKDEMGNEVADDDKNVRTPLDTEGPKIENVKTDILPMGASDETGSVIVSWTTDKPSTTLVEYDEGIISGKYTKNSIEDKSLNNSHTVIIKDLKPASSYHYRIISRDKQGNTGKSQDYTFVTPSKEKSILQLILKSLEETFSWTKNMNKFFSGVAKRFTGK
jgi:phosphodiesterase/alkaline phosphatase D-like protein